MLVLNLRPGTASGSSRDVAHLKAAIVRSNGSQCDCPECRPPGDCGSAAAQPAEAEAAEPGRDQQHQQLDELQKQLEERQQQLEAKQRELEEQQQPAEDETSASQECPPCQAAEEAAKCPDPPDCPKPTPCEEQSNGGERQGQEDEATVQEGEAEQKKQEGAAEEGDRQNDAAGENHESAVCPKVDCPKQECRQVPPTNKKYDAAIQERLWQYDPFLPERSLRQGIYSMGEGSRMRRFTDKLLAGKPVSLSAVGGSVTAGQGAAHGQPVMNRIWNWILEVSPQAQANHTLKHGAFGGSTSAIFTVCVNDMVQPDVDLVLVEFAVNDPKATGRFRDPDRLSFERLLRKLLEFENRPAVVLLQHYSWFTAGGGGEKRADYTYTAENDFNVLAQYYGLPVLSIRAAAYHLMLNKVKGFQAHVAYNSHEKEEDEDSLFFFDDMHPQDRTGHRALADLFVGFVRATAVDLANRPLGKADEEIAQEAVPAPMVPGNLQRNSSTCLLQRNFEKVVVAQQGFVWKNERPAADVSNQKWGWISEQPGSWAELEMDTTSVLEDDLKVDTNEVIISFLKSYEHMGKAKVQCVANCTCQESMLDGHWTEQASLTELHRFQASQHKQCRVKVTVLDETSSPDKGRKVKLVGMMVVEGGFSLDAMGVQLDLFANRGDKDLRMSEG